MTQAILTLDDKYDVATRRFYLTGTQALVRLPLLQRELDRRAGLNTAGFVSGYRGSPLGAVDQQMMAARKLLQANGIHFRPGVNEELAATAVWGSQQVTLFRGAKVDGVFAYWYGKGPGVDRSGDVLKHANFAGTSRSGGVLVVAGDDHACKSSTVPHQSEQALAAASIPVLAPSDVGDLLHLGLHGWGMSRWSGRYVGFKVVADVVDSSASVSFDLDRFEIRTPPGALPDVHIRLPDPPMAQEARLFGQGLRAAQDYAVANGLDRVVEAAPAARIGVVTVGKSYHDTRAALARLGLPEGSVRLLKLALVWPVEPSVIRGFAEGLDEIVVVEEKAPLIEQQLRDVLYDLPARPRVVGKRDETGAPLLKPNGDLSVIEIAQVLALRVAAFVDGARLRDLADRFGTERGRAGAIVPAAERKPFFCSGCPHNTSTRVIDGSRAMAGIGCHYMAVWMDRSTDSFSQMGGEGVAWIGQAPFTEEEHVFANLGDGTYFHSGILAIRAAVSAGVNITYKVLYNDAVAMTGGQHIDGTLTVPQLTRQLAAEDVKAIAVVTDEPEKYGAAMDWAPGVTVHHRSQLAEVERRMRDTKGCTAIVYDQTCASEKRRRRKRGTMVDPAKRAFINPAVCEACGDCSKASNCMSVVPLETALGTKRQIDQSSCNKDFSCVEGFCPSFVTVEGGALRKPAVAAPDFPLPEPAVPSVAAPWSMLLAGVGGTGIVTVAALLGMAAHAQGLAVTVLDMHGLAQKGGAVFSHLRFARSEAELHGLRVGTGEADLLLGCDLVVAASRDGIGAVRQATSQAGTRVVLNSHASATAAFVKDSQSRLPAARLRRDLVEAAGADRVDMIDATTLATALLGDAIAANLFLLGFAWQKGCIPLGHDSLMQAITLNGTAIAANKAAFAWGRAAAVDAGRVARAAGIEMAPAQETGVDGLVAARAAQLTAYQSARYARRYMRLVERVREAEGRIFSGGTVLTETVARGLHKVMAFKDEYEVARLHTAPEFRAQLAQVFEGEGRAAPRLRYHLAPPVFARRDARTGQLLKREFGPWMAGVFRALAPLKVLRFTPLDPFGHTEERRAERQAIVQYEADVAEILACLAPETLAVSVELAGLPEEVRGFGHVKERARREAERRRDELLAVLRKPKSML